MTDLAKAVAFAKHCLKWHDAFAVSLQEGVVRADTRASTGHLLPNDTDSVTRYLQEFLGERYYIQINRDKTGLFQWQVIVGHQGASFDQARAENDDLLDAIFDACVEAARMDKRA
jgi:hypothetical protein